MYTEAVPTENAVSTAPYVGLGIRIIEHRIRKNLLQRELAAQMDIDPATLSKLENGTRKATLEQARWLAVNAPYIAMRHWGYSNDAATAAERREA